MILNYTAMFIFDANIPQPIQLILHKRKESLTIFCGSSRIWIQIAHNLLVLIKKRIAMNG